MRARTIICIAAGALRLASLWESAWTEGDGKKIAANQLGAIDPAALQRLYDDKTFLPALTLPEMEAQATLR